MEAERERIVNTIGAEEIFINKSIDECLMNVQDRPEKYKEYVKDWFDSFSN